MNQSDFDFMVTFAIEQAERLPVEQRVRIYRGAACAFGDPVKAPALLSLAAELEAADRRCQEFSFHFNSSPIGTEHRSVKSGALEVKPSKARRIPPGSQPR